MIGALKAGRIFVPLDARDPPERLALVLEQVGALRVSVEELERLSASPEDDPGLSLDPDQRAIVHFTSGSSGRPKGIVRTHDQLALARGFFGIGPDDRFAIIVPLSFAGSIGPVFSTLFSGATACLFDPTKEGIGLLAEWIGDAAVTALQTSPSVLRTIAAALDDRGRTVRSVRLAVVGGEPCRGEDLDVVRRVLPAAAILNHYGSSEAGYVGETRIEPGVQLPSGPISFRRIMQEVTILDDLGQPVEPGETGEIVVRGPAVAPGYWAEPDEAEQRLVIDENGVRSARTGDRGRFLPDGSLEHLGRADLRVKVHGQMVDPQAVEHALVSLPEVAEAVVSAVPGRDGNLRLIAHVLPSDSALLTAGPLRRELSRSLPPFMIPSAFVRVDQVPRTGRGKVDRDALRASALDAVPLEVEYAPAGTQAEQALVELTSDVLALERVGVDDDLFELGVDSLTSLELLSAVHERLGVELTPGDLLEASTIRQLARRVAENTSSAGGVVFPLYSGGSGTPFFWVPAFDGAILQLRGLARKLGRPTYAFVPHGLDKRALPDRTVERSAARFVGAMRTLQPAGPYLIGGYSFGGLVAYEMARQLASAGDEVGLVALIDSASTERASPGLLDRIWAGRDVEDWAQRSAGQRVTHRLTRRVVNWGAASTAGIVRWTPRRQGYAFLCLSFRMQWRYRPGPYDGPVLILTTRIWGERLHGIRNLATGARQLVQIPGNHRTLLREPHVAVVAARLREAFAAADPSPDGTMARAEP